MSKYQELVTRLSKRTSTDLGPGGSWCMVPDNECREAARTIEYLEAEVEQLTKKCAATLASAEATARISDRVHADADRRVAEERDTSNALRNALQAVHKLISEAAMTGFNCHDGDWAERLYASQSKTFNALNPSSIRSRSNRDSPTPPVQEITPVGWKLMPEEPTEEMLMVGARSGDAAVQNGELYPEAGSVGLVYRSMYAAAPTPTVSSASAREDLVHADRT